MKRHRRRQHDERAARWRESDCVLSRHGRRGWCREAGCSGAMHMGRAGGLLVGDTALNPCIHPKPRLSLLELGLSAPQACATS